MEESLSNYHESVINYCLLQPPKKDTKSKQPAKQTAKKKEGGGGGKAKKKKWSKGKVSYGGDLIN